MLFIPGLKGQRDHTGIDLGLGILPFVRNFQNIGAAVGYDLREPRKVPRPVDDLRGDTADAARFLESLGNDAGKRCNIHVSAGNDRRRYYRRAGVGDDSSREYGSGEI